MITFKVTGWNPRYLAYCYAHGVPDPDAMLELDRERWPGGVMCGFILWINARWAEWRELQNIDRDYPLSPVDQAMFDLWLFTGARDGVFPREERRA